MYKRQIYDKFLIPATEKAENLTKYIEVEESAAFKEEIAVSYTHLTLPTTYSV